MENDLFLLLKLVLERDRLAKARSILRSRLSRSRKQCEYLVSHAMPAKLLNNLEKLEKLKLIGEQYKKACDDLKNFTKANSKFRSKMISKYKTSGAIDGSNHIVTLSVTIDGNRRMLDIAEMKKMVEDREIENILLEVQPEINSLKLSNYSLN